MSEQPAADDSIRRELLLNTMFQVLADEPEPIPVTEALNKVAERIDLTPHELSVNNSGSPRWDTYLRFASGWASKLGWISKKGGWAITEAGLDAFNSMPPYQLLRELSRRYRAATSEETTAAPANHDPRKAIVHAALAATTPGWWTSFADLAELVGMTSNSVWALALDPQAPNRHRVLQSNGTTLQGAITAELPDQQGMLIDEGVQFDQRGRAAPAQRMTADDFRELLGDLDLEPTTQRAWLVRGANVNGRDLVPTWLAKGSMSLQASKLREVEAGVTRDQLKPIVEQDYAHQSYAARAEKVDEFHAFLTKMQIGDLVVTTSQGRLYLGEITSDPTYLRSGDDRSNLRRSVDWNGPPDGIDYADLPSEVSARLKTQRDVVDLTQQLDQLRAFLHTTPDEPEPAAAPEPVVLPDATDALAERLHVSRGWLQECIDLLNDRPQLIFYGPPGTGKTYLAQEIAQHVAGDNYKLVQFHPAYSYEDFFEGYRPVCQADGSIGFELRAGPLRALVDQASENPATPYVLIIDEINRGNLAKVFGELYFLLEYRDRSIDLLYASGSDKDFTFPKNVYLIGTMNTADRSIALVDAAMRRRFAFVALHPNEEPTGGLLRRWLTAEGCDPAAADLLDELNARIEDTDFKIGPSYFMRSAVYAPGGLERVWRTAILPLLEEHHFGEQIDVGARYGLDVIRRAVARRSSSAVAETEPDDAIPAPA